VRWNVSKIQIALTGFQQVIFLEKWYFHTISRVDILYTNIKFDFYKISFLSYWVYRSCWNKVEKVCINRRQRDRAAAGLDGVLVAPVARRSSRFCCSRPDQRTAAAQTVSAALRRFCFSTGPCFSVRSTRSAECSTTFCSVRNASVAAAATDSRFRRSRDRRTRRSAGPDAPPAEQPARRTASAAPQRRNFGSSRVRDAASCESVRRNTFSSATLSWYARPAVLAASHYGSAVETDLFLAGFY